MDVIVCHEVNKILIGRKPLTITLWKHKKLPSIYFIKETETFFLVSAKLLRYS